MTSESDSLRSRIARLPLPVWVISGLGVLVLGLIAVSIAFGTELARAYVKLDAAYPEYAHPDGLVLSLGANINEAQVNVETTPRELFLADDAGKSWAQARAALPSHLSPLSPLYTIRTRSEGAVTAEMAIPNGADPLVLLDLYRWDEAEEQWEFVPSELDLARGVITFQPDISPMTVMAVHATTASPTVGVVISDASIAPSFAYQVAIPEGVEITAAGEVLGAPVDAKAAVVTPLITNRAGGFTAYESMSQQGILDEALTTVALPYDGLVLDFEPAEGFSEFVASLSAQSQQHGKTIDVVVRGDSLEPYNIPELARHVDRIWIAPGEDPNVYLPGGLADTMLESTIRMVDRARVGLLVSGLNVDVSAGETRTISLDEALGLFGSLEVAGEFDPTIPIETGSNLPFRLTGRVESMGFDIPLGMNYLTYRDDSGSVHYVYFGSAQNLARQVAWARFYGIGAVGVSGVAHPSAPPQIADGLTAFLNQQPVNNPAPLEIVWRVESSSGASLDDQSGDLTMIQYLWQALVEPGDYVVSAGVNVEATEVSRGEIAVAVAQQALEEATPTPAATPTPRPAGTPDPNATPRPQPTAAPVQGGIVAGQFELGGQTQSFGHPDQMRYAGMTWVKFQHKWNPGDDPAGAVGGRIADAHARGFKVLLSIPGPANPSSIDYGAYTNFVAGVAALGPDAIEIWNEMNFNYEWPANEISGESYVTKMLAPAYQAIKAANPAVMVISGAPTPTGAFNGCGSIGTVSGCDDWFYIQQMRDAGAGNYLDCVGVHYNEGIISPTQTTGDPRAFGDFYSRYFFGMVNLYYGTFGKPLCLTELGYLSPEGYGALPANFAWAQATTVAQHAQWLAEAAVLSSQSGKVRLMIIFNVDFTSYGSDPQAGYAMIRPGGGCPACDALAAVKP